MRNLMLLLIICFCTVLIVGCLPVLRSAGGLNKGQMQVSYDAPLAGSVRYGISDNLEYRYSVIGESFSSDLMFHKNMGLDYSLAVGLIWRPDYDKGHVDFLPINAKSYAGAATLLISKETRMGWSPYLGYGYSEKSLYGNDARNFISSGIEFPFVKPFQLPINIVVVPEVMLIPERTGGDFDTAVWLSCGFGINFDLHNK